MNHPFRVHIPQRVDNLSCVVPDTFDGERAHLGYSGLQFSIPRQVQHEDWTARKRCEGRAENSGSNAEVMRERG